MSTTLYRFYDAAGSLLYVGISDRVAVRYGEHRSSKPWFELITSATLERFDTREEALIAESAAIRDEEPIHNIQPGVSGADDAYIFTCDVCGHEGIDWLEADSEQATRHAPCDGAIQDAYLAGLRGAVA